MKHPLKCLITSKADYNYRSVSVALFREYMYVEKKGRKLPKSMLIKMGFPNHPHAYDFHCSNLMDYYWYEKYMIHLIAIMLSWRK